MQDRQDTHIQWLLGNICNYNCSYCPDHLHSNDTRLYSDESLADSIRYVANELRAVGRDARIEFVGGEPTLHEGIITGLSSTGSNQPGGNKLTTNGSASLEWYKENYIYFSHIEISYHIPWANLQHIVETVNYLKTLEEGPSVEVMVHATNDDVHWGKAIDVYEQLIDLSINAKIKLLYSNFTRGNQYLPYKNYQLKYYYETIGEVFSPKATTVIDPTGYIPTSRQRNMFTEETVQGPNMQRQSKMCNAGIDQLVVWKNGDVYRGYCKAGGSLGNVRKRTFHIPNEAIECPFELCQNGFDRQNSFT